MFAIYKNLRIKSCFLAAVFVIVMSSLSVAHASTATGDYTDETFTFTGTSCAALYNAWLAAFLRANPSNGAYVLVSCNPSTLALGDVTIDFMLDGTPQSILTNISFLDAGSSSGGADALPATAESQAIDRLVTQLENTTPANEIFDPAVAGGVWAMAFTSIVGLFLVARFSGAILDFIRRG